MSHIAYFGYGSLVNTDTLTGNVIAYAPARLKGWRRQWQARQLEEGEDQTFASVALLSVYEQGDSEIDGLVVIDSIESLPALDKREHHYDRVRIVPEMLTLTGEFLLVRDGEQSGIDFDSLVKSAFVYRGNRAEEGDQLPSLLQSYLDVVLAGFYRMHGEGSLERFVDSTDGFQRSMIADRQSPLYPRSLAMDQQAAERHDALLRRAGVSW